ncbi:MAG: CBS and ACT domain-containing protein [Treponema sp.]|nr:CBS and ACT domain-containing protein [Treponema sp.]
MLVKDVMSSNPVVVGPEASVLEAKEMMKKNKVNILPVVDKSGMLTGILSKGDLEKASPSAATTLDMFELGYLLSKLSVEKTMVKNVKTTTENQTVEETARLMKDYGISCLPVVNNNVLVGLVTQSDLFSCFIDMFSTKSAGIRAVVVCDEKPGVLAGIVAAIAEKNANIVSVVTNDVADSSRKKITLKVEKLSIDELKAILENHGGLVEDIRSV